MLRILRKRYPLTKVYLLPVRVQGAEAPGEIASAIRYANHFSLADLLIVGRGGGSIEDLWAFNEETVARAIYDSRIPVISAVGHEPDVTISDFVADLRAATPSNAAELAVPDQDSLRQILDTLSASMANALNRQLKNARRHLQVLSDSPALQSPKGYILQRRKSLELLQNRFVASQNMLISRKRQRFVAMTAKLDAMSPLKVLSRGYAMAQKSDASVIRSIQDVTLGDQVQITLSDGSFAATVADKKERLL
jgi:exodeoxyribonuclease VII large subunit